MNKKLHVLEEESHTVLFTCQTVFPFTFFPVHIELSETRISLKYGVFFFTYTHFPVLIKDLVNVVITEGIFFSAMQIELVYKEENPPLVKYLRKKDATNLKNLILGLIETHHQDVNLQEVPVEKEVESLKNIGKTKKI